jgi:hypothetical protein
VTTYLPLNPPTLGDDDEGCSMMLVGQQIRLCFYGLCCWYLDEDAMVWRGVHSIPKSDELP